MSLVYSQLIRKAYSALICWEGHPSYGHSTERLTISFRIRRNQTLEFTLNDLAAKSGGLLEWKVIGDVVCVLPKKTKPDEVLDCFDAVVSLDLERVSAWEAFMALEEAVNKNNPTKYPFSIKPASLWSVKRPASAFLDERTITLRVSGVTAREAACAIIQAAPLPISYNYGGGPDYELLVIECYNDDGEQIDGGYYTPGETEPWMEQVSNTYAPRGWSPAVE